ncbi:amino acid permease [Enterobacteriaceae endosymbiont of Plateumaris consimilis]|uniref:amino acid permease n=1 Tax=Enterobacteriaceae endosymbiont of Plateumaris consimilis TaxID=2675794 RepID=UPI0014494168|nr:amino acid permease [Enterobacteriaceae endosymbiont of Plateumaris consimilis]QJC28616.1 amino acid permease [Enterobacteriaceae endosymbiont of Plateumaris consimilis]
MIKNQKDIKTKTDTDRNNSTNKSTKYNQVMTNRHVQMIAIGGAIGSGLFLGTGSRLHSMGIGLIVMYLICGLFCFFIMRALGELLLYRPSSGSFVSYSSEFLGNKAAYVCGWMYFINWIITGIIDITAITIYMYYWNKLHFIPQWSIGLITVVIIGIINIIGVKWFAEIEFCFSMIKVIAIITFLIIGTIIFCSQYYSHNNVIIHNGYYFVLHGHNQIFPNGFFTSISLTQGVIFSFASIELIGTASEECKNPKKIIPKAINSIIFRIIIFYVGSILLLILLMPWNEYKAYESPFITYFNKTGFKYIAGIMNFVVLSAAFSSLNAGLYSTSRILRSLAIRRCAPKILTKMNKNKIPYVGIIITLIFYMIGVYLNYIFSYKILEIMISISSLGIISAWTFIILCQMKLRKAINLGKIKKVNFKMPGAPFTSWLTLCFLMFVTISMFFTYPNCIYLIICILILTIILCIGWLKVKKNVKKYEKNKKRT